MKNIRGEEPPPKSTDLEGWCAATADGKLSRFRLEDIAAAYQDLGPSTDRTVRNALTRHLSNSIVSLLRPNVSRNRPNGGEDTILDVHDVIFGALLRPHSADGKGLRKAFGARVIFRLKDVLARELKSQIVPAPKAHGKRKAKTAVAEPGAPAADVPDHTLEAVAHDREGEPPDHKKYHPSLLDGVRDQDEQIGVDRILATIPSWKKRLAFQLFMDDVPWKSTRGNSIAKACGVSERTARDWIKQIQEELKQNEEAQELLKLRAGAKS